LRRRCSAYRRRQNLYSKNPEGLQRAVTVQRLLHNWVRPHGGLGKNKTPAMTIGLYLRPISMLELLSLQGFTSLTSYLTSAKIAGDLIKQVISECENRLELEERKQQEEGDRLRSLISSKKQEFENSRSI